MDEIIRDLRSPLAKARDKFEQSETFKTAANIKSLIRDDAFDSAAQYLKNRLRKAYIRGWEDCEKKSEMKIRIKEAIEQLEYGVERADKPESDIMQEVIDILSEPR